MVFRSTNIKLAVTGLFFLVSLFTISRPALAASNEISGLLKVDAEFLDHFDGTSTSDIMINRAELHLNSTISEWISSQVSLLYRQSDDPLLKVDLEIDNAYIEYGNAFLSAYSAQIGQLYVPFGWFETNMASDPLTRVIAETREVAFAATFDGGFSASIYVFNGELLESGGDDSIDNIGANLSYRYEGHSAQVDIGFGYINNFGDSDFLSQIIIQNENGQPDVVEYVPGIAAHLNLTWKSFQLIGEITAATKEFAAGEIYLNQKSQPSATNLEMGYNFAKSWNIAIGMQNSVDMSGYLPASRLIFATSYKIDDSTRVTFEYANNSDYDNSNPNGTGESGSSIILAATAHF